MRQTIIFNLIVYFIIFLLIGCSSLKKEDVSHILPHNATNITELGNGWIYFDLNETTYLYYRDFFERVTIIKK